MRIRPAASSMDIADAMNQVTEVYTYAELVDYLKNTFGDYYDLGTLMDTYYGYDERVGWDTYIITADLSNGQYKKQAVVFADNSLFALMLNSGLDIRNNIPRKIKCIRSDDNAGWFGDEKHELVVGELYDLVKMEVHTAHTRVWVKGIEHPFNSVLFSEVC